MRPNLRKPHLWRIIIYDKCLPSNTHYSTILMWYPGRPVNAPPGYFASCIKWLNIKWLYMWHKCGFPKLGGKKQTIFTHYVNHI